MKFRWLLLLVCLLLTVAGSVNTNPQPITLAWDYPTNAVNYTLDTNNTFFLFQSADLTVPLTNWVSVTNVVGTNRQVTIIVQPRQLFFYVAASNFWGLSPPSNVALTPPIPQQGDNLSVRLGN